MNVPGCLGGFLLTGVRVTFVDHEAERRRVKCQDVAGSGGQGGTLATEEARQAWTRVGWLSGGVQSTIG
jgi:hypothetical protein